MKKILPVLGVRMMMKIGNHNSKQCRPLMKMKFILPILSFFYYTNAQQIKSKHGVYPQWIASVDDTADCDKVTDKIMRMVYHGGRHLEEIPGVEELKGPEDCFVVFDADESIAQQVAENIDEVEEVAPNEVVHEFGEIWNLDRIDQPSTPLDGQYKPAYNGKGVNVYIIDTGVETSHDEYRSRASKSPTHYTNDNNNNDNHGHGTHCAGTAVGKKYGVAKGAKVVGVKVLGANGGGSTSGVVAGIQWAVKNAGKHTSVISMSLGGSANTPMKKAAQNAAKKHIVVVAAGNSNADACRYSPANAGGKARKEYSTITVGSTTSRDERSSFSNYGSCVDIWAPGSSIKSAWKGGTTKAISGTSMATPHVAGVAALYLEKHRGNKKAAMDDLFANSVGGKVYDAKKTVNLFLQVPTERKSPGNPTVSPSFLPTVDNTPKLVLNDREVEFWPSEFGDSPKTLINAPVVYANSLLCSKTSQNFKNKIVIVSRGTCLFITKVLEAQQKGALAVLIAQDSNAVPFIPKCSYNCYRVNIPSAMITRNDSKGVTGNVKWGPIGNMPSPSAPPITTVQCGNKRKRKCRRHNKCKWNKRDKTCTPK